MPDEYQPPSVRYLNVSAVKEHALKCSKEIRAGTFTRVSDDFITEIHAETEALVRKFNSLYQPPIHAVVETEDGSRFVTGVMLEKVHESLDNCIARMIQAKVQRHPSVGCTLKS
jgi:hypothetical protein